MNAPAPPDVPQTEPYVSPYGLLAGLPARLGAWSVKLRRPQGGYFVGLGLIADLELAMRLLNLREFAQWLFLHGADDQQRWAAEILDVQDEVDEADSLYADIERVVPVAVDQPYAEAVEIVAAKAVQHDLTRAVLEQLGAIAPGDTETDVPALLRALLS